MSVKGKKRGRPAANDPAQRSALSAEHILTTAKSLMREQGKMPSIRALAGALDVDAMAIYYYFKNKQALQTAICQSLIEEIYHPVTPPHHDDWQLHLHALCVSYLTLLGTYAGLLDTFLSMPDGGPAHVFIGRFEQIIAPLGLSGSASTDALHLLVDYLHGFAHAQSCAISAPSHDDPSVATLSIAMMEGPFNLYCKMLTQL